VFPPAAAFVIAKPAAAEAVNVLAFIPPVTFTPPLWAEAGERTTQVAQEIAGAVPPPEAIGEVPVTLVTGAVTSAASGTVPEVRPAPEPLNCEPVIAPVTLIVPLCAEAGERVTQLEHATVTLVVPLTVTGDVAATAVTQSPAAEASAVALEARMQVEALNVVVFVPPSATVTGAVIEIAGVAPPVEVIPLPPVTAVT
jgi:hypothetical protein